MFAWSVSAWAAVLTLVACGVCGAQEPAPLLLEDLVRAALEGSPEIQGAARMVEASAARVGQAGALPDPMLAYGVMNEGRPVPFQTLGERDFSEAYLGLSQDLPFPGKRRLRTEAATEEVEAARSAYEAVRRRVCAAVADAYYDLYSTDAGLDVVEQSARLLDQLIEVAHTRLSVGQTSQQDVLDAELEMSRLEERRTELDARRAIVEARIRSLLNRRTGDRFGRPPAITPSPLRGSLEELVSRSEQDSPALGEKARTVAQAERLTDLAKRDRKPDFSVNFTYHNRGGLDPMYTFGGTVSLPNLHGRQARAVEEAAANLAAAQSAADSARTEVRYAVTEAFQTAKSAERLLLLYDEGILKQARLSLDSALAQYGVGKVEFGTLIASWRRLLDYDLAYQEQLAVHEKALARLAVHVGAAPSAAR